MEGERAATRGGTSGSDKRATAWEVSRRTSEARILVRGVVGLWIMAIERRRLQTDSTEHFVVP